MKTTITTSSTIYKPCPKCHGNGHIRGYEHIANGLCFRCSGEKFEKKEVMIEREMTDDEIIKALDDKGFIVLQKTYDDYLAEGIDAFEALFKFSEESAEAMKGAKLLLQNL